jgi:hypothetical protein
MTLQSKALEEANDRLAKLEASLSSEKGDLEVMLQAWSALHFGRGV